MVSLNPKKILQVWGILKYDKWRQSLIDLKIIWSFIKIHMPTVGSTARLSDFLEYWDSTYARYNNFFPTSNIIRSPPPYLAVSLLVQEHRARQSQPSLDNSGTEYVDLLPSMVWSTSILTYSNLFPPDGRRNRPEAVYVPPSACSSHTPCTSHRSCLS